VRSRRVDGIEDGPRTCPLHISAEKLDFATVKFCFARDEPGFSREARLDDETLPRDEAGERVSSRRIRVRRDALYRA